MEMNPLTPFETAPDFPWIPANENGWGIVVLDLRKTAFGMTAMTDNSATAESFLTFRDGSEYVGVELPISCPTYSPISCPSPPFAREGPLTIAAQMEDKWNVYHYGGRLFFTRSWTGELIHTATIDVSGDVATVISLETKDSADGYDHIVREVDFLIRAYVLERWFPHPLPPQMERSLQAVIGYSFQIHGRRGAFATCDDTLKARHPEHQS